MSYSLDPPSKPDFEAFLEPPVPLASEPRSAGPEKKTLPKLGNTSEKPLPISADRQEIRRWTRLRASIAVTVIDHLRSRYLRVFALITFGKCYRMKGLQNARCQNPMPDGCTWVPNFNFREVCDRHDLDYAAGGSEADRYLADLALKEGILAKGHPILARLYYAGVRLLGRGAFCYYEIDWLIQESNSSEPDSQQS